MPFPPNSSPVIDLDAIPDSDVMDSEDDSLPLKDVTAAQNSNGAARALPWPSSNARPRDRMSRSGDAARALPSEPARARFRNTYSSSKFSTRILSSPTRGIEARNTVDSPQNAAQLPSSPAPGVGIRHPTTSRKDPGEANADVQLLRPFPLSQAHDAVIAHLRTMEPFRSKCKSERQPDESSDILDETELIVAGFIDCRTSIYLRMVRSLLESHRDCGLGCEDDDYATPRCLRCSKPYGARVGAKKVNALISILRAAGWLNDGNTEFSEAVTSHLAADQVPHLESAPRPQQKRKRSVSPSLSIASNKPTIAKRDERCVFLAPLPPIQKPKMNCRKLLLPFFRFKLRQSSTRSKTIQPDNI